MKRPTRETGTIAARTPVIPLADQGAPSRVTPGDGWISLEGWYVAPGLDPAPYFDAIEPAGANGGAA